MSAARRAEEHRPLIVSYITLRRWIGILGMALPLVCVGGGALLGGTPLQRSISYYYHTNMRDFLVGLLAVVSVFFLTYRGYEKKDRIVTTLVGLAGLGLAFFPIRSAESPFSPAGLFRMDPAVASAIHVGSAGVFFFLLAVNSIFLFTLGGKAGIPEKRNKIIRNRIHRICGGLILASLAGFVALWIVYGKAAMNQSLWVLALQTIMLVSFGVSWLIKGETLFRDKNRGRIT